MQVKSILMPQPAAGPSGPVHAGGYDSRKGDLYVCMDRRGRLFMQISEQLRHLILSGRYEPGTKLPSSRELSQLLQVNRNTISNALEVLRNEGLVEIRHGVGIFVKRSSSPPAQEISETLKVIARRALKDARGIGYNENDLAEAIQMVAHHPATLPVSPGSDKKYIVFVECNKPILETYKWDIEAFVGVKVVPFLLDDLREFDPATQAVLEGCECVATTYSHLYETKSILKNVDKPILGITAAPYVDLRVRVSHWPRSSRVLVIMMRKYGAESIAHSIQGGKTAFASITPSGLDVAELPQQIAASTHLIITRQALDAVQPMLTPDKEYTIYENRLDSAGLELLKKFLTQGASGGLVL